MEHACIEVEIVITMVYRFLCLKLATADVADKEESLKLLPSLPNRFMVAEGVQIVEVAEAPKGWGSGSGATGL